MALKNLRSFSIDTTTGKQVRGARFRRDPDRYIHVLVPEHEQQRFAELVTFQPTA